MDDNKHHRKSIRLDGYDYSRAGWYFITICISNKLNLLGRVENGRVIPNHAGIMVDKWWGLLPDQYHGVELHAHVVMPNHFHGIIEILYGSDTFEYTGPGSDTQGGHAGPPLHRMVQWFKTMTTNEYIRGVKDKGWKRFDKRLWQRNYYEHIIRDKKEFIEISEYIINNPLNWERDEYFIPAFRGH